MAAMAIEKEHLLIVGTYSENLGFVDGKGKGLYAFRLTSSGTFGAGTFLNKPLLGLSLIHI